MGTGVFSLITVMQPRQDRAGIVHNSMTEGVSFQLGIVLEQAKSDQKSISNIVKKESKVNNSISLVEDIS